MELKNTRTTLCCFYTATMIKRTYHNVAFYVTCSLVDFIFTYRYFDLAMLWNILAVLNNIIPTF